MMKNETLVVEQHQSIPVSSLVKPSMSRTLVYRTNQEFDKCAELLRNILTVQESRRNLKSSPTLEIHRKHPGSSPTNTRARRPMTKPTATKPLLIKPNLSNGTDIGERRSSYSPSKPFLSSTGTTGEDQSVLKTRSSPTKSRKHPTRSPSPTVNVHPRLTSPSKNLSLPTAKLRQKSPSSSFHRHRSFRNPSEFVRSSSCGDLPAADFMRKQQTRLIIDQFVNHLTRIRTLSKQIRTRNGNTLSDPECHHLWGELDASLVSALTYANDDIQLQLSLEPLRDEIFELRKQLQSTNDHLRDFDNRRSDNPYAHLHKKFDSNQIQCSQLLIDNQELKTKCDLLQEKLDHLERNNIRLVQRWTQQELRSLAERTGWISTDNRFLLRQEIFLLKEKFYHVYDDLATLFTRNHTLEISHGEQKQQLLAYRQQWSHLRQSTQQLLLDVDKRTIDEKIKRFLDQILLDPHPPSNSSFHPTHTTPTRANSSAVHSSSFLFETPHKASAPPVPSSQIATSRARPCPTVATTKLRPKSLFVTPTVLNDTDALSRLRQNHSPTYDLSMHTPSSSSTICDAESILTTSSSSSTPSTTPLYQKHGKRMTFHHSLPALNLPQTIGEATITAAQRQDAFNNDESGPELDQISDLTSKMFSSEEEDDDVGIGISDDSITSSSTVPSVAEQLI